MNNGKVRIYELSKELDLENKVIQKICDQLNIAVKSHSSTITEAQAERIRAAAERYTANNVAGKSGGLSQGEKNSDSGSVQSPPRSNRSRKQQILEIRPSKPRSSSGSRQSEKENTPRMPTPPRPPVKPQPHKSSPTPQPSLKKPQESLAEEDRDEKASSDPQQIEVEKPQERSPDGEANQGVVEKPQLLGPPARPTQESSQPEQPKQPQNKKTAKVEAPRSPKPPQLTPTPTKAKAPEKPTSEESSPRKAKPALKEPPKLQRPSKPKPVEPPEEIKPKKVAEVEEPETPDLEEEQDLLELPQKPKPKLKRPAPPRPSVEEWEEEDEDEKQAKKAGKPAAKGKRRVQPLIDDDEDELETELTQSQATVSVSLSMARPPKPKAANGQQGGAVATSGKKQKKPVTPKTDAGNRSEKSDRRREKKAAPELPEIIVLEGNQTVRDLAELLNISETEIIKKLFMKGIVVNVTQMLDLPTAKMVAEELGVTVETPEERAAATKITEMIDEADLENLQRRPPVVTIMGHVDHGKTTLLDSIRSTKVAQGEAGGITQHIGAYHVDVDHDGKTQQVVFLDTPGHEAFTAMRARGTRVTDIAVLVVAADDGVQPQTKEAISHARAAKVPIVVAINKIDKEGSQPDRVKQELTEQGLVAEEWGGETIMVPVSAIKGENLDTLLEMILLVSEVEQLEANPDRLAKGTVIEAHLDKARGPVATLLVQNGTLRVGDCIVAGSAFGKIRAMIDDRGQKVEAASPSFAVEVLGLADVPEAGDEFDVFASEKEARAIASQRSDDKRTSRLQQAMGSRRVTLSSISEQAREGELKELNLILKADVQGSVEAILGSLKQLPQNEVQIRVLLAAPGEISETDVDLAAASGAIVIGFSTTLASGARQAADREGVDIREYNIIYNLLDEIQGAMEGLLDPEEVEEHLGQAEVRAVFTVGRGAVAGCYVQSGRVVRNSKMRVRRGGEVIYEGNLSSLKRVREDVKEVKSGFECGIGADNFNAWEEGDIIEAYQMVLKRRTLSK
ncbi:translation initiation factor IF-2 [Oscillatoria salina]|uniref:translation initiation factor IF-2 n=1 Tax=Oscillatoria salina TaxID=331517 RepID=UPI0013BE4E40|nr:translation initiation factor IF-2 [Oscillatoria salina]MBZ8179271.1 translation initiation factor IF-2 [Oscillatoria salina IIICB1]NET86760.1 translation initiation factor IF-2 [Kamptonema sp. SIO1D9]